MYHFMELRHLRYFIAVAEELHFGRAAQRLNICQPPLSQQIKSLEDELEVRLFDRSRKNISLTEAGSAFLVDARAILRHVESCKYRVRRISAGQEGELRLGLVPSALDTFLPEAIGAFRLERPGITLELNELGTLAQLQAIGEGRIDLGIVRLFEQVPPGLNRETILREPYVLAIPHGHPLSEHKSVPLAALDGQPLLFFPREQHPRLFDRITACFAEVGSAPNIVQEASTKRASIAFVAARVGVALVPSSAGKQDYRGVVFRAVLGDLPWVEFSMVWRDRNETEALQALRRTVQRSSGLTNRSSV
jgi:DNA-binding transcriptional LysR family regulator